MAASLKMVKKQPWWLMLVSIAVYLAIMCSSVFFASYALGGGTFGGFAQALPLAFRFFDGLGGVAGMILLAPVHWVVYKIWKCFQ